MNSESTAVVRDFAFNDDYYVVAISDVHMGFDFFDEFEKPRIPFQSFIEELESKDHKMDHFVILGDFLDLWRGDDDDVFKKGKSIVQSLVDMKGKKIGKLHYLVGNHDFNIPWYKWDGYRLRKFSRKRRELLMEFNFKGGSSTFPRPLILPEDDKTLNGKSFVFKHGHQDRYAEGLRPLYDLMCALLGGLGNETGWMASIAWKYKYYAPHLATVLFLGLTSWMAVTAQWLTAGILGIAAFLSFLATLWVVRTPGYKQMRALMKEEDFKEVSKLKGKEKLIKLDSIVKNVDIQFQKYQIEQEREVDEDSEDTEVDVPYKQYHAFVQQMKPVRVVAPKAIKPKPRSEPIVIVGHTHESELIPDKKYNTGAWVERKRCRILTIDKHGTVEMWKWPDYEKTL